MARFSTPTTTMELKAIDMICEEFGAGQHSVLEYFQARKMDVMRNYSIAIGQLEKDKRAEFVFNETFNLVLDHYAGMH